MTEMVKADKTAEYSFTATLEENGLKINPVDVATMQLNITRQCNQYCRHCHVDASPHRMEKMSEPVMDRCLEILARNDAIGILDITGGAPELHPGFRHLVEAAGQTGKKVMVRHNLTVTLDGNSQTGEELADLPPFFADNKIELISSLPYYQEYYTDRQRGAGVFEKSIKVLKLLNGLGYGREGSGLILNLVYNPAGAFLPASQATLEQDFKKELLNRYGIVFNNLYTITNMPINRFKQDLEQLGMFQDYLARLKNAFNPDAARNVMCRFQLSIGYDGRIYDCDFNQMLGLPVVIKEPVTVFNFNYSDFLERSIIFGRHCYGCTAGAGSSCGGATT